MTPYAQVIASTPPVGAPWCVAIFDMEAVALQDAEHKAALAKIEATRKAKLEEHNAEQKSRKGAPGTTLYDTLKLLRERQEPLAREYIDRVTGHSCRKTIAELCRQKLVIRVGHKQSTKYQIAEA